MVALLECYFRRINRFEILFLYFNSCCALLSVYRLSFILLEKNGMQLFVICMNAGGALNGMRCIIFVWALGVCMV